MMCSLKITTKVWDSKMDPNANLRDINAALHDGDYATARERADDLSEWLGKGGFTPDWTKYPYAARYFGLRHPRFVKEIHEHLKVVWKELK